MAVASRHYERAFEAYLIRERIPHLMVDDARRAVMPPGAALGSTGAEGRLKSFDAVVYGAPSGPHLLVEVKGRRVGLRRGGPGRRECWSTTDDVRGLQAWERLFGSPYQGVLLFWYWLDGPVLNALERRIFRFEGRAYAHRAVRVGDYARSMRVRSPRWGTVTLPTDAFERAGVRLGDLLGSGSGSVRSAISRPIEDGRAEVSPAHLGGTVAGEAGRA